MNMTQKKIKITAAVKRAIEEKKEERARLLFSMSNMGGSSVTEILDELGEAIEAVVSK
jgi:hypothetical protein